MSDEATIRASLQINKGNIQSRSYPTDFKADVTGSKGPSPGSILVTKEGTDVDLNEIGTPGFCRIMNQDDTNRIMVGIWDGASFHPIVDLLPGEFYVIRLSEWLGDEFETGTGTATTGTGNTLRIKAVGASCIADVGAFDK